MSKALPIVSVHQEQGRRSYQEDRCLYLYDCIQDVPFALIAVADGMGGHRAGDIAAEIVIASLERYYKELKNNFTRDLRELKANAVEAILEANKEIAKAAQSDNEKAGMGTTLVMAIILGNKAVFFNVGDSRGYLFDEHTLDQITKDHSAIQQAVDKGYDVSSLNIGSNVLVNCLDGSSDTEVDVFPALDGFDISNKGILLCSDGVSGFVEENIILSILNQQSDNYARKIVEESYNNGSDDNITAIVLSRDDNTEDHNPIQYVGEDGNEEILSKGEFRENKANSLYVLLVVALFVASFLLGYIIRDMDIFGSKTDESAVILSNGEDTIEQSETGQSGETDSNGNNTVNKNSGFEVNILFGLPNTVNPEESGNDWFVLKGNVAMVDDSIRYSGFEIISPDSSQKEFDLTQIVPLNHLHEAVKYMRSECSGQFVLNYTVGKGDTVRKIERCTQVSVHEWRDKPADHSNIQVGEEFVILGTMPDNLQSQSEESN
ncbi:Serine/threonine protein phosphatase PrpC [Cyclonatronum proteinivorum]|uniref:Serine/threonine protein phosphatase PrpC n=1 Tax=Cyclonatronum proteinivorum TaxID=1457365 RepID=A0A345UHJ2_9BACT|nr:protein phosphatase 2C domain-containing protein [Cyclonatronum proteinivorum]AXI99943.1 Serine/threonine protein phosphatase PrpC [Cyclonatronum proteinivorum]